MDAEVSEESGAQPIQKTVSEIFKVPLRVPNYQRDYEWDAKLVWQLLVDLYEAHGKEECHLGVIILHNNQKDRKIDIVDGQQRLTTLALINRCLKDGKEDPAWEYAAWNKNSQDHFRRNKKFIEDYLQDESLKERFQDLFSKVKLTVIQVDELSEAFQLYNTQNTRGKDLDAVDILKAYHLKAMEDQADNQEAKGRKDLIIEAWERRDKDVKNLFHNYLYPVVKWSGRESVITQNGGKWGYYGLSKQEWELFRGVSVKDQNNYDYVAAVSENRFQILSPFREGEQFFKYVFHYLVMVRSLEELMKDKEQKKDSEVYIYPFKMKKDGTDPERIGVDKYKNQLEWTDWLYLVLQLAFVDRFKHSDPTDTKILIEALKSSASDKPEHQRLPDLTKYELEQLFLCSFYYRFACHRVGSGINAYVLRSPSWSSYPYPNENPFIALRGSRTPAEFFFRLGKYGRNELTKVSEEYELVENPDFSKHLTKVQNG